MTDRLRQQISFIQEIDKLKQIVRRTVLLDRSRYENDAEHSWHLAMMALVLWEYAPQSDLDWRHVLKMLLLHDLVEIDAGDTFLYDEQAAQDKAQRETVAAERIFGLLPADQMTEYRALWAEFDARQTPAAQFAGLLDRLQPLLHNYLTHGQSWKLHGVTSIQVKQRWADLQTASPVLWAYAQELIRLSVENGSLAP
jgi:putative hydrolases of HD superfamily